MVNYLAVLVAAIAAFAVGMLWYTVLFGKMWRKEMGIVEGASMDGMATSMIGGFISTLVMTYVLAGLIAYAGNHTLMVALAIAFWIWLGFVATIMSNIIWYEKRSWRIYLINAAHYLTAMLVAAAVLQWLS